LKVAAEIPVHISTEVFPLEEANRALNSLKNDAIRGAAVLKVR
jgi:D-arabinose 1-dehydrogenase-like Zn-dependent alcohol dehydrogenase